MTRRARDILLDILRDEGITHVFGNPGSTEMPLMDALVDAPDIDYVLGLQEATAVGMADGWALAGQSRRLRQPARDGRPRQRDGRARRLQGERDAAGRHRRPAGHPPSDDRAVALGRSRRARGAGDQMGQGGAARRGRRPGAAPRLRHRAHAALRAGVPVAADGRPRPGGQRPDAAGLRPAAARPLARRGAPRRDGSPATIRSEVVVLLGDDLPAVGERRASSLSPRRPGFAVWGTQLTSRAAFPSAHPCWAGVLKPDFAVMRDAFRDRRGDRAGRRPRLRRLSLSRRASRCPRASPSCMSPTIRRRSAASTPPTWRCSATSARRWRRRPRRLRAMLDDEGGRGAGSPRAGASKRAATAALRAEILAESAARRCRPTRRCSPRSTRCPTDALIANDSAATFGARPGPADDPARPLFLRPRRRARLQHAGRGRRVAGERRLGRLVRRRRRRDVFAAGAVERRALSGAGRSSSSSTTAATACCRTSPSNLGYANAVAGRFVGMDVVDPRDRLSGARRLDGRAGGARRRPRRDRARRSRGRSGATALR